jgi:predicted type IV restriction endonuclease
MTEPDVRAISRMDQSDVGPTEEDVKQKIVVPLLGLLGHARTALSFESATRGGGRADIIISVSRDSKIVVDTKKYAEDLDRHLDQIRNYAVTENALLAVLANGTEIRIYTLMRAIDFKASLLHTIARADLAGEQAWKVLTEFMGYDSLRSGSANKAILRRESEIRDIISQEDALKDAYSAVVDVLDFQIEEEKKELALLEEKKHKDYDELRTKAAKLWSSIGLPPPTAWAQRPDEPLAGEDPTRVTVPTRKARKVGLQELVDAKLLKDGQVLFLCNGRQTYKNEQAFVVAASNRLRYKGDNQSYSKTDLARKLLKKLGVLRHPQIQGPLYWRTAGDRLLKDLEDIVRAGEHK